MILDIAGNPSLSRLRRVLAPRGTAVLVGGEDGDPVTGGMGRQLRALVVSLFVRQRLAMVMPKENGADIERLAVLLDGRPDHAEHRADLPPRAHAGSHAPPRGRSRPRQARDHRGPERMTTLTQAPAPTTRTLRTPALVAGLGILAMSALSGFAIFGGLGSLVTDGDAAATARDIAASEGLFRASIAALVLIVVLDVLVAWGLFEFFKGVHPGLSRLAAWFRVAYAVVFAVAISQLASALHLLGNDHYLSAFDADQLHASALLEIGEFNDLWQVALALFGVHLVLIGYLAFISGQVPKVIGGLLVVAGLGYLVDSFGVLLVSDYSISVGSVTFVGEALLMLWLLVRGRRLTAAA